MLCAISGEAPQEPVASKKTGVVYEKRLIETYISEHGRDPTTGEDMTTEDLISLKNSRLVRPRPPTLTSIPSLLSVFQNEWDALALETFNLQQQLQQTRQELSTALYQNDAAVKVIDRLTRERDEARDTLAKIGVGAGVGAGAAVEGEEMVLDSAELPEELVAKVEETHQKLSKTRRKRPVPEDWATEEELQAFKPQRLATPSLEAAQTIALNASGDLILSGGKSGQAYTYSLPQESVLHDFEVDNGDVTDAIWSGSSAIIASSTGAVRIYNGEAEVAKFSQHAGKAQAIAIHPSGDILASVGVDKSIVFYDLISFKVATQIFTNSALTTAAFHPDGNLFAAGATDGHIKIYDVKLGSSVAEFETPGVVRSLAFSENGIWLASSSRGQTSVLIWDLRKQQQIKSLDTGAPVHNVVWDYTGQFLAAPGPSGVTVFQYTKSSKEWSEPLKAAVPCVAAQWGPRAESLVVLGVDGSVSRLG